jgi:dGTPase
LKRFSFANIYCNWRLLEFQKYAENVLGCIYRTLLKLQVYAKNRRIESVLRYAPLLQKTFSDWLVKYTDYDLPRKEISRFRTKKVFDIDDNESYEKCAVEFISGMTDQFAIKVFEEIISF